VAAVRGERDIAVGNVVGSNIFNLFCVLGLGSIASPSGIGVSPAALRFDIPVMIAVAVACLPVFFEKLRIGRIHGTAFLAYYGAYLVYLVFSATEHDALDTYAAALRYFVLPITAATLVFTTWRSVSAKLAQKHSAGLGGE
jgi:cation:H+ antiporter